MVDDDGLRRLLKFPEDTDLAYYRDRVKMPYVAFKQDGKTVYRYVTSQVLQWMVVRQHNTLESAG